MVKNTQTICWLLPINCLSVLDYFLGLALKGLNFDKSQPIYVCKHALTKKESMSIDFSFRRRPECQSLSKAFHISSASSTRDVQSPSNSITIVNYLQSSHEIGC